MVRTPGRPVGERSRRVEVWSQVSQAFATIVALLLAVPGVIFAMRTYHGQQVLNREQLTLNEIALARNERRYASRVSFWDAGTYVDKPDEREHVTLVKIRNMTPLPVTDVVLRSAPSVRGRLPLPRPETGGEAAYRPLVQLKTIPPCHEMDVWVHRGDLYGAWLRMLRPQVRELDIADVPNWATAGMYFVVAGKNWEATHDSLEPRSTRVYEGVRSDADFAAARIGDEATATSTPISDCGEAG
jgi:hypothetical protein